MKTKEGHKKNGLPILLTKQDIEADELPVINLPMNMMEAKVLHNFLAEQKASMITCRTIYLRLKDIIKNN